MIPRRRLLRALDANINRSREGLRVTEDLVRFCLERPALFRRLRRVRHALDVEVRKLPATSFELARARDSAQDPGREARASSARSIEHLLLMNLQRTKEALRVVEEASRLLAPARAAAFQRLRFQTYDIERDLLLLLAALRHH